MGNEIEKIETERAVKKMVTAILDDVREIKKILLNLKKGKKLEEEVTE